MLTEVESLCAEIMAREGEIRDWKRLARSLHIKVGEARSMANSPQVIAHAELITRRNFVAKAPMALKALDDALSSSRMSDRLKAATLVLDKIHKNQQNSVARQSPFNLVFDIGGLKNANLSLAPPNPSEFSSKTATSQVLDSPDTSEESES